MARAYTPEQKQRQAENFARWKANNPDRMKELQKEYLERHPEKVKKACLKHYNENYKRPRQSKYTPKNFDPMKKYFQIISGSWTETEFNPEKRNVTLYDKINGVMTEIGIGQY